MQAIILAMRLSRTQGVEEMIEVENTFKKACCKCYHGGHNNC